MKKIVKLKEADLVKIIKKVVNEQNKTATIAPTQTPAKGKGCPGGKPCGTGCCAANEICSTNTGQCYINATPTPEK
jgi:hypothetical protein